MAVHEDVLDILSSAALLGGQGKIITWTGVAMLSSWLERTSSLHVRLLLQQESLPRALGDLYLAIDFLRGAVRFLVDRRLLLESWIASVQGSAIRLILGKSEYLRVVLVALRALYSPEILNDIFGSHGL